MNKTKIDWADYTWNPITGCLNGCWYCYARKIYQRFKKSFKPSFHPKRLKEISKLKEPSNIFVGSVTDLWGYQVKEEWRREVFIAMAEDPQHTYFILTKKPHHIVIDPIFWHDLYEPNIYVGVTIEKEQHKERWSRLQDKLSVHDCKKFISFEPILGEIRMDFKLGQIPDWVVIGGLSKPEKGIKLKDQQYWAEYLLDQIPRGIPVFIKDNLKWKPKLQEMPC